MAAPTTPQDPAPKATPAAIAQLEGRWTATYGLGQGIEIVVQQRDGVLTGSGALGAISDKPETGYVQEAAGGSTARLTLTTAKRAVTIAHDATSNELRCSIGAQVVSLVRHDNPVLVSAPASCTISFTGGSNTRGFAIDTATASWQQTSGPPIVNNWTSGFGAIQSFVLWPSWVMASGQVGNFVWTCIHFDWQPGSGNSAPLSAEYSYVVVSTGDNVYGSGTATWP
jgi:hypothetical protein